MVPKGAGAEGVERTSPGIGEDGSTGRRACRVRRIELVEQHALFRQAIDVGSLILRTVAAQVPMAQIVRHAENNIGGRGRTGLLFDSDGLALDDRGEGRSTGGVFEECSPFHDQFTVYILAIRKVR